VSEKYEFIETMLISFQSYVHPVALMCRWLSLSRSGFYDRRSRPAWAAANRRCEPDLRSGLGRRTRGERVVHPSVRVRVHP
jgi:hypothetical protein